MSRRRRRPNDASPIAVRAYIPPTREPRERERLSPPELVLVLDMETTTDESQRLTFGSYRVYRADGRLHQEGLVAADDLSPEDRLILERYVVDHSDDRGGRIRLWTRTDFAKYVLWPIGYKAEALIVGFNLPFDLSRLALAARRERAPRRKRNPGMPTLRRTTPRGFSLRFFEWVDDGVRKPSQFRPNIRIQSLGSKRDFISFTGIRSDVSEVGAPERRSYRGRFLDLRTLSYVLTDRSHSLASAAKEFGSEPKAETDEHGVITPAYIDYNRQDVRATFSLYQALRAEWDRHPIELQPEQAFSPAAVGKAYLRALGIRPPRERPNLVPDEVLGYSMVAYFGGRAECRIRQVELPVRYVDFTSMYPTAFVLLELWRHVTSDHFESEDATEGARSVLAEITREALHERTAWPALAGVICRVRPSGQLLPARAQYGSTGRTEASNPAWTIGLNYLGSDIELWYTLADLVAAKLLGGSAPEILEAIRVRALGVAEGLAPVALRNQVPVDPAHDDLFKLAIEARGRIKQDDSIAKHERDRLEAFLKVFANAAAYGVNAEFRQLEGKASVTGYGLFRFQSLPVTSPEEPGAFCFPPLAATITGAGRLLLALAQADVETAGGTYAACDTDSLAIVASRDGGLMPCPNGPFRLPDGRPAVKALSWAEVESIRAGINRLNPYGRDAIPDLLKLEDENVRDAGADAEVGGASGHADGGGMGGGVPGPPPPSDGGDPREGSGTAHPDPHDRDAVGIRAVRTGGGDTPTGELFAIATSSKRYVLYRRVAGRIDIRRASNHGSGLYRSPIEPRDEWKHRWPEWVDLVWRRIIAETTGADPGPEEWWFNLPAVSQVSITTPALADLFSDRNKVRAYRDQVKPFGFLLIGHVDPLTALPSELAGQTIVPIAPYTSNPAEYLERPWFDRRTGRVLKVTTTPRGQAGYVRLKTYRDVVVDYRMHPEVKSGNPAGGPGHRGSIGVLPRLHVNATTARHIGKESNKLEESEDGLDVLEDEAFTEYRDPMAEWAEALTGLRAIGVAELVRRTLLPERTVRSNVLEGRVPRQEARLRLLAATRQAHTSGR